ncbi:GLPGLI family protein [Mucilaginibacter mali]|uniref:GLPGLI family protein n=1 Tax=Mucilaginibacter mali TaxID=2740462 RepID=A0A7D4UDB0_9SPHI|nr:GLPGLI family protein [Mucilaginibacter mali]QKJ30399.1 GLPGLI family protein [Mucilaginibacter mali]
MKKIIITILCLLPCTTLLAQFTKFTHSGTVEFEKTINLFTLAKGQMSAKPDEFEMLRFNAYKKNTPQYRKLKSVLTFTDEKTLYTPVPIEINDKVMGNDNPMARQFNTVYNDLATGMTTVQKNVYEDLYLVKDSTRRINWKLTDETREIAGYVCRRANALIMDSVYVVAFYTNEIHVSGGPETFTGLPGMILGVALPHEGVTWFATKVTDTSVPAATITVPKKGKPVNPKQLSKVLWDIMKTWSTVGNRGPYEMKVFMM